MKSLVVLAYLVALIACASATDVWIRSPKTMPAKDSNFVVLEICNQRWLDMRPDRVFLTSKSTGRTSFFEPAHLLAYTDSIAPRSPGCKLLGATFAGNEVLTGEYTVNVVLKGGRIVGNVNGNTDIKLVRPHDWNPQEQEVEPSMEDFKKYKPTWGQSLSSAAAGTCRFGRDLGKGTVLVATATAGVCTAVIGGIVQAVLDCECGDEVDMDMTTTGRDTFMESSSIFDTPMTFPDTF